MSSLTLGNIEVQKDKKSQLWHSGRVVDVKSDSVVSIAFENDVWPRAEYPVSSIRKPPKMSADELEKFNPHVGEEVELRVSATEHAPAGWGAAVIRNMKHDFFFVALVSATSTDDGSNSNSSNAICEKDMLRPRVVGAGLTGGSLQQELYKIPRDLEPWIGTSDALGCFAHIEEQSGLIFIQIMKSELKLIGDQKSIQRARMLLQLHIKHQGQIQNFQETLEKQLSALEKKRNRIEGVGYKHFIEFQVDASCIPRIIGKGGEAIRSLQEKYDVNISILPEDGQSDGRTMRIFANNMDNIEKAKADVEYVKEAIPVDSKMKTWILGRGGRTIQAFKESAGLVYARLDQTGEELQLMGTRNNVQDARAMFDTHMMYYEVFNQMNEEMEQILSQLEEYGDTNARWEWGWYMDEDLEDRKGGDWKGKSGKGSKGGGKGGKGKDGKKGKDWWDQSGPPKGKSGPPPYSESYY